MVIEIRNDSSQSPSVVAQVWFHCHKILISFPLIYADPFVLAQI